MTVGFEAWNEAGTPQVITGAANIETSVNLALRQIINANLTPIAPNVAGDVARSQVTITYAANKPIVAFSSSVLVAFKANRLVNGVWEATYIAEGSTTAAVRFFVFDETATAQALPPPGQNCGLEVYNGDQTIRYHSAQPPFAIVKWDNYATQTYTAGRSYAVIPAWHGLFSNFIFDGVSARVELWSSGARVNGPTVTIGSFPWATKPGGGSSQTTLGGTGQYSVIDVTGL